MQATTSLRSTLALLTLLLDTTLAGPDLATNNIADLGWGTSQEAVKATMLAKPGVAPVAAPTSPTSSMYVGGVYGGERVVSWLFSFDTNHLWKASILLETENVDAQYEKFRAFFEQKYQDKGVEVLGTGTWRATYWLGRNLKVEIGRDGVVIGAQNLAILRDSPNLTGL
jgi:hypothetical protein